LDVSTIPLIYLIRHGETAWSASGQHTGLTDIPLTAFGEQSANRLGARLAALNFRHVRTSPLQRARKTCELAGFGTRAVVDADLVEWNYGDYEGKKSAEIREKQPDWNVFRHGCPGGESVLDMVRRADRVVARLRALEGEGDIALFSSGHFLRSLAARWCGWELAAGASLLLGTTSISILGYEHDRNDPGICLWNDVSHLAG
jgi:broad specificity phosphatase PhoE